MKIGITMATYQRADDTTPVFLKRALESIMQQTYTDWKLYVVGDKYENEQEFFSIVESIIPPEKLSIVNLVFAKERDLYNNDQDRTILWNTGGTHALNTAIDMAVGDGVFDLCHLDHDDYWLNNHLHEIATTIGKLRRKPAFVFTQSRFIDRPYFPAIPPDGGFEQRFPSYASLIHSSVYIDYKQIPLRYRNVWETSMILFPSDGDMWERCRQFMKLHNMDSYIIKKVTCVHDLENH